jgi:hypothetical protein
VSKTHEHPSLKDRRGLDAREFGRSLTELSQEQNL